MKIIKYQLETEINYGTPEEPDIETVLSGVTMPYTPSPRRRRIKGRSPWRMMGNRSRDREPKTLPLICWQTMRNACVCWNSPQPLYDKKGEGPWQLYTIFASC